MEVSVKENKTWLYVSLGILVVTIAVNAFMVYVACSDSFGSAGFSRVESDN